MIINNKTTNELPQGLLTVWTNNPRIITSSIYNNSVACSEFLSTKVIMKVKNIFLSNIERFITSIESIKTFVSTKIIKVKKSFSNYFFETPKAETPKAETPKAETPKADISAVYRKARGQTKEELRILPNLYIHFSKNYNLNELLEIIEAENDKLLPPSLSPIVQENPMNSVRVKKFSSDQISAKGRQELESFLKELEEPTLNEVPKSAIIEEMIQKNEQRTETINARLKKCDTHLIPVTPLTNNQEDALKKELNTCSVDWLEKPFVKLSNLLQLDSVELSIMMEKTHKLIENLLEDRQLKSESKSTINNFQKNLKKLQDLVMHKQVIQMDGENLNQLTTSYKNYIELHENFLKKATNNSYKNIENSIIRKQSPELTKFLAEIENNLG